MNLDAEAVAHAVVAAVRSETRDHRECEFQWLVDELRIERHRWRSLPWRELWSGAAATAGESPSELQPRSRDRLLVLIYDGEPIESALADAFRFESGTQGYGTSSDGMKRGSL
jgi:hypothetical protein